MTALVISLGAFVLFIVIVNLLAHRRTKWDYEHCECCGRKAHLHPDYRGEDVISKYWLCEDCASLTDVQFQARYYLHNVLQKPVEPVRLGDFDYDA